MRQTGVGMGMRGMRGMRMSNETKAYWKRRALRAEHELETIRRIREFEHKQERSIVRVDAAQAVALREIQEILNTLRADEPTAGLI